LPSEITAAVLRAQLEGAQGITQKRLALWNRYHASFAELEMDGLVKRPTVPQDCAHNGHIYYLLLNTSDERNRLLKHLNKAGIGATFHYIPLHSAPAGQRFGRVHGGMTYTDDLSARILRLPVLPMTDDDQAFVITEVKNAITTSGKT
jgi:dTDP-4-amino-4,6-dideoxygalactose transaminase